jgi:hypothetical protein
LDHDQLPFRALHLSIHQGALYAVDGSIPTVFKGTPDAPLARLRWQGQHAFLITHMLIPLPLLPKLLTSEGAPVYWSASH